MPIHPLPGFGATGNEKTKRQKERAEEMRFSFNPIIGTDLLQINKHKGEGCTKFFQVHKKFNIKMGELMVQLNKPTAVRTVTLKRPVDSKEMARLRKEISSLRMGRIEK